MQQYFAVLLLAAAANAAVVPYNTAVVRSDRVGNSFAYSIQEAVVPASGGQAVVEGVNPAPVPVQKYQSFVQLSGSPVGYAGVPLGQSVVPVDYTGYAGGVPLTYASSPFGQGVNYMPGGQVPVALQSVVAHV